MRRALFTTLPVLVVAALGTTSCATDATTPRLAPPSRAVQDLAGAPSGVESAPFNLQAVLRAPTGQDGFGLVKFRQSNDAERIAYLDVWVRDLAPNSHFILQRATDAVADGNCTGTDWLDLSSQSHPTPLNTDDRGTGRVAMHLDLAAFPVGSTVDIHFRLVDAFGGSVVLTSNCYQFTIAP